MTSKLKLGLIGCGRVSRLCHMAALASLSEIAVVALAEPGAAARREAARRFPAARQFESYQELLAVPDVDAVLVSVPTFLHARVAAAAFCAGKHVYLEKPLALDLAEGARLLEEWRSSGAIGMIGFNFRNDARYLEARLRLLAGEVGRPLAARTVFSTARRGDSAWRRSRASGGGALLELASHDFDLVRFVFGREVLAVQADLQSVEAEHDLARVVLRLEGGLTAQCLASTCTVDEARLEIYGDRGMLTVDRFGSASVEVRPAVFERSGVAALKDGIRAAVNRLPRVVALRGRGPLHSYRAALRAFAGAALGRVRCTPDLDDGYRSLVIATAAELAAAGRREVALAEVCNEDSARG